MDGCGISGAEPEQKDLGLLFYASIFGSCLSNRLPYLLMLLPTPSLPRRCIFSVSGGVDGWMDVLSWKRTLPPPPGRCCPSRQIPVPSVLLCACFPVPWERGVEGGGGGGCVDYVCIPMA